MIFTNFREIDKLGRIVINLVELDGKSVCRDCVEKLRALT